jgi:hypothetical protein
VLLFTGDARTETGWETVRRETPIDLVVGGVGVAAGVTLAVGSLGTLSAPGVLIGAGSAALLASGYGWTTSLQALHTQSTHRQSVNPFTSAQARLDWMNLVASTMSIRVIGRSTAAAMQMLRARGKLLAAMRASEVRGGDAPSHLRAYVVHRTLAVAHGLRALDGADPLMLFSAYGTEEGLRYLIVNWDDITPAERNRRLGMLGLNAIGLMSPAIARGHLRIQEKMNAEFNSSTSRLGDI